MTCGKIWTGMKKPGRDDMYEIFQNELKTGKEELVSFTVEYDDALTQSNPYCQLNGACTYRVSATFRDQ